MPSWAPTHCLHSDTSPKFIILGFILSTASVSAQSQCNTFIHVASSINELLPREGTPCSENGVDPGNERVSLVCLLQCASLFFSDTESLWRRGRQRRFLRRNSRSCSRCQCKGVELLLSLCQATHWEAYDSTGQTMRYTRVLWLKTLLVVSTPGPSQTGNHRH